MSSPINDVFAFFWFKLLRQRGGGDGAGPHVRARRLRRRVLLREEASTRHR